MTDPAPSGAAPIPAFINPDSGGTTDALAALEADSRFAVVRAEPARLAEDIGRAVAAGARRVLVAGGDGTLRTAAGALAGEQTEMAVVPAGTLNHFAKRHDIPTAPAEALKVAAGDSVATTDVGYVNGRVFLNTSSVGAYVTFVRTRERLERRLGYWLASVVAAFRILAGIRTFLVELEVDGRRAVYRTPLVFFAVGERELKLPSLGGPAASGRRGLHVMIVRGHTRAKLAVLAFAAAARGTRSISRTPHLDSFLVERCRIDMPRPRGRVATDGEILLLTAPLEYRLARDALRVVVPPAEEPE
ncbi:MAG: diacylglycerol/lipid kinase family protein [Gemmatimonadaceae bacterium]